MHTLHCSHVPAEISPSTSVYTAPAHVPPITHNPSTHSWRIYDHDIPYLLYEDGKDDGLPIAGPSNDQARTQTTSVSSKRYGLLSRDSAIRNQSISMSGKKYGLLTKTPATAGQKCDEGAEFQRPIEQEEIDILLSFAGAFSRQMNIILRENEGLVPLDEMLLKVGVYLQLNRGLVLAEGVSDFLDYVEDNPPDENGDNRLEIGLRGVQLEYLYLAGLHRVSDTLWRADIVYYPRGEEGRGRRTLQLRCWVFFVCLVLCTIGFSALLIMFYV
ncbi:hypothetical protein BC629DRAFT_295791 [Irpex lacteus]|nr:hypothetical protein BC629DRAFT_295791 [Irpex lacteus]